MENKELLAKENEFIRLRNTGRSLKQIAEELQVSSKVVNSWNVNLTKALRALPNDSPVKVSIVGKNPDGKYQYQQQISFQVSLLEKMKFQFFQLINSEIRDPNSIDTNQVDSINNLKTQAVQHLQTISTYVTDVNNIKIDVRTGKYNFNYNTSSNEPAVIKKINEAINFYADYIHYREVAQQLILIQDASTDTFHQEDSNTTLPFALKQIRIQNFNGIINTHVENVPVDTQWIFLTGENGFGKTSFLQAITIGLLGNKDGDRILVDNPNTRISIEFKNRNEDAIHHLWIPFQPVAHLAAYGSSRLEIQNTQSQSKVEEALSTSYSLFNTDGVLHNIEFELYKWFLKGDKKFNVVKKLFKKLIPHLADIKVDTQQDEVLYIEKDISGKTFEAVPFKQLASGFRSIIAMVGDVLIRLYKQQPEEYKPEKLAGIVLIDEFDLHLHPKWQRELPGLLSRAFPKVQFIVSTHSVIPFLGAPSNSVFLKVSRDKRKGIEVEKLDIEIKNLLPNTILTSALFDMNNITQRNNNDLSEVRTEDNYQQVIQNDQIKERLKQFEESDIDFSEDIFEKA